MFSLSGHRAIGWDFDGTLIDHRKSGMMMDFIRRERDVRHVIVTFRSHGWQHRVFPELRLLYRNLPVETYFAGVLNMPDDLFRRCMNSRNARRSQTPEGVDLVSEQQYVEWKGLACRDAGLTVLVDDLTDEVVPGCLKYGIRHIHPDHL